MKKLYKYLGTKPFVVFSVTIVGAYIYAVFSMIASGVSLNSMEIKTIMVFLQNALLLVQVSCQGKISFHSLSGFIKTQSIDRQRPDINLTENDFVFSMFVVQRKDHHGTIMFLASLCPLVQVSHQG